MSQPQNDQGSNTEDIIDYVTEDLIEQPNNSLNHLSTLVAATEGIMELLAVLSIYRSAIASSSKPVPQSDGNSNSNGITNMARVENTGFVNGITIRQGAMSLGCQQSCQ
jgi:hypothetical protein